MIEPNLRNIILARPERLLEDRDVMNALVAANERAMGANVVDLRGIAMQRLETRLDRLEDTHRSVIAAAYENLAGTNQVHRAILQLLEPQSFETIQPEGSEFGLVMIRRLQDGGVAMLGEVPEDNAMLERAARKLLN